MPKIMAGRLALLGCALIWGVAFLVMKDAVDGLPVLFVLAIRFVLAFPVMALCFLKKWKKLNRRVLMHGFALGVLEIAAYIVQSYGLRETTPGKNAFLSAIYCVLVPFVDYLWFREKLQKRHLFSAVLCLAGIGLIAVDSDLSIGRGDLLTLVCGVIYALQVTACAHYAKADDAILLTMLQLGSSGLIAGTLSLGIEGLPPIVPAGLWPSLLFLAFGATALALFLQNVGQGLTPSGEAGILLSLESVFGAAASVLFGYEILTGRVLAGFIVVFIAVLAAEWSPRKRQTAAVPRR